MDDRRLVHALVFVLGANGKKILSLVLIYWTSLKGACLMLVMIWNENRFGFDKDTSQSKQNLQSSSTTFIYKTLIIPSFLDSCFISSTVSEDKRVMLCLDLKICAKDKNFSSIFNRVSPLSASAPSFTPFQGHVQNFNRGSTSSNCSNVNGSQWNENVTPSTTIPLAGSTRLPPVITATPTNSSHTRIPTVITLVSNVTNGRQPNRRQRVTEPGTTTSRRSRRTTIRDIPRINFDKDEGDTTPKVFDKFSGISKESLRGNQNASKKAFSLCCNDGKVLVAKVPDTPEPLLDLFLNDDAESKIFRNNIRTYNSMFSFTSMGGKIDHAINRRGHGPFVFRLHEHNHHSIGSLLPEESKPPKFAQLYIFDKDNEVENRAATIRSRSAGPSNERHPVEYLNTYNGRIRIVF
ncbi:hypothetical protein Tco_1009735 [Tanacetum coccineum]